MTFGTMLPIWQILAAILSDIFSGIRSGHSIWQSSAKTLPWIENHLADVFAYLPGRCYWTHKSFKTNSLLA